MTQWTLYTIEYRTYPVKVYVNKSNTTAIVFPLFGRYFRINSDVNVLDLATDFILKTPNSISYESYLISLEDTVNLNLEDVA